MIRAILMDFNGVVIDDEHLQQKVYTEVLKDEGIDLTEEEYFSMTGMNDAALVREVLSRAKKDVTDNRVTEIIQKKTARWRERVTDELPIFDGVENFIKKSRQKFATALVSMANREEINHVLDTTGLRQYFDVVITAEDVSTYKPNPECYISAFRQLDAIRSAQGHFPLERHECVVIEDVPQGIKAGKAAGMKTLGVLNTFDEATMRSAGADAIAKNLNDWFPDSLSLVFSKH